MNERFDDIEQHIRKQKPTFHDKLKREKERRQDRLDFEREESRGNQISSFSTNLDLIVGSAFFVLVFVGLVMWIRAQGG